MNGNVIQTTALTRHFKSLRAVDALTIEVPRGIVFGFLGPNGSGKTTTIRMLLGVVGPTSGYATVLGFDTATQSEEIRLRCGALLEHPGIYEKLSAEDNLDLFGRICKMPGSDRRSRIKELLQTFGLWDRRKDSAGTWSRGMKQKLGIIRAMLHRPELVFLDEPTAGLDPAAAAGLRDELTELVRREGVTVFLTTHNLPEAEKLCARVAVIRNGKLLAEGKPQELRGKTAGQHVEIAGDGFTDEVLTIIRSQASVRSAAIHQGFLVLAMETGEEVSNLVPVLIAAGVRIEEIRREQASLEDVFLKLVEEDR